VLEFFGIKVTANSETIDSAANRGEKVDSGSLELKDFIKGIEAAKEDSHQNPSDETQIVPAKDFGIGGLENLGSGDKGFSFVFSTFFLHELEK